MSRNFELLQRLSKDQEMFDTGTELSSPPAPEVAPPPRQWESVRRPVSVQRPKLDIDEKQRDEIMKCVQKVLMPRTDAPRTIVLTAVESGAGCTWICCRAAQILASQVRGPVCVVDANLRSPGLHQYFGMQSQHGLAEALTGTEPIRDFVRPLGGDNLWLLSCGANATNSQSLLISDAMRFRLAELRKYFEYVLLDAPAMNIGVDALALARASEGVILVLKANSSRRETARKAVQDLQSAGVRILGAILNQRTFPIPEAIYSKL